MRRNPGAGGADQARGAEAVWSRFPPSYHGPPSRRPDARLVPVQLVFRPVDDDFGRGTSTRRVHERWRPSQGGPAAVPSGDRGGQARMRTVEQTRIRAVVTDDSSVLRLMVRQMLEQSGLVDVVGEAV